MRLNHPLVLPVLRPPTASPQAAALVPMLSLLVAHASGYTVLNNTDFPSNCANPYSAGLSAGDCAAQCTHRHDCVAVIFAPTAAPPGGTKPGACAFKCRSDNPTHNLGIQAVIVHPGKTTCTPPPPPPSPPPPFTPPDAATDPDWLERYEAANLLYADKQLDGALMPYIGNGYLATHPVAGRQPHASGPTAAEQMATLYVSGVFNGIAVQSPCEGGYCAAPHRAKIPTYRAVLSGLPALGGRYALDLEKATLTRRVTLDHGMAIEERWYAHLVQRELLVHEILLNNSAGLSAQSVAVEPAAAGPLDGSFPFSVKNSSSGPYGTIRTVVGASNHSERPELQRTRVAVASNAVSPNSTLPIGAGESKTFYFISAVATSLDASDAESDPQSRAEAALIAALQHPDSLRSTHEAAWLARWNQGRLEVGGNLGLAQATNSSLYFLLSSVRADWPLGMSPGGLASDGYAGHTFWDQEFWMVPTMILMQPDSARSCLQYRIDRFAGAASKAKSQGYAGLMMPCESAFSGYEVQGSAGNGIRSETERGIGGEGDYGLYEQHWNSDIPYAAWQWWEASGNVTDLKNNMEPWLRGVAEFWTSRVETHRGHGGPVDGLYHINHVMPPDEYVDGVDDGILANFGASTILRKAVAMAKAAGREPGANWTDVAEKIYIPFDKQKQYHPEYAGFEPGKVAPKDEWNGGHGADKVKQADAILIGFPYDMNMSAAVRKNDLEIYENCTDGGSVAMTWGMFAVGWLDVGEQSKAEVAFKRGYANIKPPFGVWTETPTGGTVNFITGSGGFLQSVLFGYGGLRLREGSLDIRVPPLPSNTTSLTLNGVHYRGSKLRVLITPAEVLVSVLEVEATATALGQAGGGGLDLCRGSGSGSEVRPLTVGKVYEIGRSDGASIRPSGMCGVLPATSGGWS